MSNNRIPFSIRDIQNYGIREHLIISNEQKTQDIIQKLQTIGHDIKAEALMTIIEAIRRSKKGSGKQPSRIGLVDGNPIKNPKQYLNSQIDIAQLMLGPIDEPRLGREEADDSVQDISKMTLFTTMPSAEQMLTSLRLSRKFDTMLDSRPFSQFFIQLTQSLSNRKIYPSALNILWATITHDAMGTDIPLYAAILDPQFNDVVDAISPDPRFARDTKVFRNAVLARVNHSIELEHKEQKKNAPKSQIGNPERYIQCEAIKAVIIEEFECGEKDISCGSLWFERASDGPNPFYDQTNDGFYLEFCYSSPSFLHTPWGKYDIIGSVGYRGDVLSPVIRNISRRLGAKPYKALVSNDLGQFGPIYSIHEIDGMVLPEPSPRDRGAYAEYEDVVSAWNVFHGQDEGGDDDDDFDV